MSIEKKLKYDTYVVIRYENEYGLPHRTDGPACIGAYGKLTWALNGVILEFDVWCELAKKTDDEIAYLILKYDIKD